MHFRPPPPPPPPPPPCVSTACLNMSFFVGTSTRCLLLCPTQVRNHNTLVHDFLGVATLTEPGPEVPKLEEFKLYGKSKKEREVEQPGKLFIEVVSSEDLTSL